MNTKNIHSSRRKTMATSRLTKDGLVIDFSDSEVKDLMNAEDFSTYASPIVSGVLAALGTGVIGAIAVGGIVATLNIHKKEFSLANQGNGVEVTLPWWAIVFQLWGALLMKPLPPPAHIPIGLHSANGSLWHTVQPTPSDAFGNWQMIGTAHNFGKVVVGSNADGRLEAFTVDATVGRVWHAVQDVPNGSFGDWSQLGDAMGFGEIAVISTHSGSLEVFATDMAAGLAWTIFQDGPNGNFEGWVRVGDGAGLHQIAVGKNADGRLEVFAVQM
jgi:hypothetical protein